MLSRLKAGLRQVPALHRPLQKIRHGVHGVNVRVAERLISRSESYEILVVFGMRRSGNHLAINWILDQVHGSAAFYNNISIDQPPYSAQMTEVRWRHRNQSPRIVLSYEDVSPEQLLSAPLLDYLADRTARHRARVRFALILRDPYNLFASRIKKWPEAFHSAAAITAQNQLYIEHARLAVAPEPIWRDAPLVPILYNDLVSNAATRERIAGLLGIRAGDLGLDQIPVYGHGSSFDGTDLPGSVVRGTVFSRWQALADNATFRAAVRDPELQATGRQLFDMEAPIGVDGLAATRPS